MRHTATHARSAPTLLLVAGLLGPAVKAARQPTVVVAGATGTVGRELVRILRRQDVPTVALGRDVLKAKRMLGIKTKCKEVDLSDAESIAAALPVDEPFPGPPGGDPCARMASRS